MNRRGFFRSLLTVICLPLSQALSGKDDKGDLVPMWAKDMHRHMKHKIQSGNLRHSGYYFNGLSAEDRFLTQQQLEIHIHHAIKVLNEIKTGRVEFTHNQDDGIC